MNGTDSTTQARSHCALIHCDGRTSPTNLEFPGCDDYEVWLREHGFSQVEVVGDPVGIHYELYEHVTLPHQWVVLFGTCSSYTTIACESWPDFIDLLGKISPIVAAADDRGRTAAV